MGTNTFNETVWATDSNYAWLWVERQGLREARLISWS